MENNFSPKDIGNLSGLFVFTIDNSEFCINMQEVIGIIRTNDGVSVFNEADSCIRYRGEEYRIIPLSKIYNLIHKNSNKSRVLLLDIKHKLYSMLVDKINEVIAVKEKYNKTMSFETDNDPTLYGIIKHDGQEIRYPDYASLVQGEA